MELKEAQIPTVEKIKENSKTAKEGGVVFFGDSIIEFWDIAPMGLENAYNCGIRQSSTKDMMFFHEFAVRDYHPKTVVFLGGANDLSDANQFDKLDIANNIYNLVQIFHDKYNVENVIVLLPLPIDEARMKQICRDNVQLRLLGEEIKNAMSEFDYVTCVDCFDDLLDNDQLKNDYTLDGIHLNAEGCKILANKVKPLLK